MEGNPAEISRLGSDWARWTHELGRIADGTNADSACEFYNHFESDIDLAKSLNANGFRLSLNWAALCPERAGRLVFDPSQKAYYLRVLQKVKACGMTSFVTLFHFALPGWLADIGGWENPETIEEFGRFAELAAVEFGDLVDYWLTLNEPLVYVYYGYINGTWPPGIKKDYLKTFQVIRALLEGHARGYQAIHRVRPDSQVSFTKHWRPFVARSRFSPLDQIARYLRDQIFNHVFLLAVESGNLQFPFPISQEKAVKAISGTIPDLKGTMDYLAFNYFTREICEFKWAWPIDFFGGQSDRHRLEVSGLGWEVYPEGLFYLLSEDVAPYRLNSKGERRPIFITENGIANLFPAELTEGDWSLNDDQRCRYLIAHLVAVYQAIQEGANVKGYFHWSLIDNFEWADGLKARFGLVRIQYPTQERTPRRSAGIYKNTADRNAVYLTEYPVQP